MTQGGKKNLYKIFLVKKNKQKNKFYFSIGWYEKTDYNSYNLSNNMNEPSSQRLHITINGQNVQRVLL